MNTKQFIQQFGKDEAERVAVAAGTNFAYFKQLSSGHRWPSPPLAERLVAESDGRLDFVSLLSRSKSAA